MGCVSHAAVLETCSATQQGTAVFSFFIYLLKKGKGLASMIFSAGFDLIILTAMFGRHRCDKYFSFKRKFHEHGVGDIVLQYS
jgi:hypothetical protein